MDTDSSQASLVVENLRRDFGRVTALSGIDIALTKPGVYGFLGPNGAGKTTTFKLICGLLKPTTGRVMINGVDISDDPRQGVRPLGMLFDSSSFYPYLTGEQNLQVISRWLGGNHSSRIRDLLALVGLTDAADRRAGGYSWGMKQRLGLAAALLSDPQIVLLDEPTNGLDPAGIADIRRLLPKMAYEQGRIVFLSSHRMDEVEQVCDEVTIIYRGKIVASGKPDTLASGGRWIEITCDDVHRAREVLQGLDDITALEQIGNRQISCRGERVQAGQLNKLLVENGILVEKIAEHRESLEDTFLRLTGGANSAE